ncbi:MAG: MATE family efflux transporter [Clostridia bacterium]|nr:MATE family efflux transporter [Clostridia bacterium]
MQTANASAKKDSFYRALLSLALPLLLQNLMNSAVSAADTLMLGFVGQSQLAASSLAGNLQFLVNMFIYGIGSGSSVLIAQYWGRKDYDTIERTIGIALRFTLVVGLIFSCAAIFFPASVMRIYTTETELIDYGVQYLRIVGFGYFLNAFTQVYISSQRSMERVMFGTVVNLISMFLNVILNACFIFGFGPFPELGIVGVAIATLISQLTSFAISVFDASRAGKLVRVRIAYIFSQKKELFRDFVKYTLPALGNDFSWGLGFSMYSVILGRLGSDVVAANSYAGTIRSLSTVLCFALANACAIIMGKTMGENKLDEARVQGRRFLVQSIVTGCLAGLFIFVVRGFVVGAVNLTDTAKNYLNLMLLISSVNVIGQSVNTMCMCGIFRSGGDTRYGFICDTCVMWIYGVGLGLLCAFVFKLPPIWVYFVLFMDETVKMIPNFIRYTQKKWVRNITRDMASLD